ncbi:MAG: hypothetical protein R2695_18380 [Acidimicrobiales bacterium]
MDDRGLPSDPDDVRRRLCALGEHIRATVVGARGVDMAEIDGVTAADTIYAIDRIADDELLTWFERHWPDVEVVSEGLDEPVVVGSSAEWTVIVDTIDGTRGLMYDKRSAWSLAAAAPHGGRSGDLVAAAMTELPTTKQGAADQLSGVRGGGVIAERRTLGGGVVLLAARPSTATDLDHGFGGLAKFFPPGKPTLAEIEARLFARARRGAGVRRRVHQLGRADPRAHGRPRPVRRRPPPAGRPRRPGLSPVRHVHGAAPR